ARKRANAVDEHDWRVAEAERIQSANSYVWRRTRGTLSEHADTGSTCGEKVADRRDRQLFDFLVHVAERGDAVSELDASLLAGRRRDALLKLNDCLLKREIDRRRSIRRYGDRLLLLGVAHAKCADLRGTSRNVSQCVPAVRTRDGAEGAVHQHDSGV